eukprot:TRINITY_DN30529_c0_g1_i1.p1 TRINITY_DN30529_c0_g1~~TRINITY_DN30529_c0_g1_i1.p1  ORF type:complete len:575 (+),score=198.36 TRINITY_DN30529_c0_g1_i1:98-1726(+)
MACEEDWCMVEDVVPSAEQASWQCKTCKRDTDHAQEVCAHCAAPRRSSELVTSAAQLFPAEQPKNFVDGTCSGLKTVGKGVGFGLSSLVAMPIAGGMEGGPVGAVVGAIGGCIAAAGLVTWSTTVGAMQFVRGAMNTPACVREWCSGQRIWDKSSGQWVEVNIDEDAAVLRGLAGDSDILDKAKAREKEEKERAEAAGGASVRETELYEVLGVAPAATPNEIRRAYYRAASTVHPDKCRDADAKERFQAISKAYEVLSDAEMRERYDARGKSGIEGKQFSDPATMFAALFGSAKFEPHVGKLHLLLRMHAEKLTDDEMACLQHRREMRLAVRLAQMLRPYVDGNTSEFREAMVLYADDLAATVFGDEMLAVIGHCYQVKGRQKLSTIDGGLAQLEEAAEGYRRWANTVVAGGRVLNQAFSERQKLRAAHEDGDELLIREVGTKLMPNIAEVLWEYTGCDIVETLSGALERLFCDCAVTEQQRILRAEGLVVLGRIFTEAADRRRALDGCQMRSAFDRVRQAVCEHGGDGVHPFFAGAGDAAR